MKLAGCVVKLQGGSLRQLTPYFFLLTTGSHSHEQSIILYSTCLNRILTNEFTSRYFLFMCIKQSLLINFKSKSSGKAGYKIYTHACL